MVGLTIAIALGQAGLTVAAIDRDTLQNQTLTDFDGRVSAVALGSIRMLERLGVWQNVAPHAQPIYDIRVSEGYSPFYLHYDHREVGEERFGVIAENRHIRYALQHRVSELDAVTLITPAAIKDIERTSHRAILRLDNGRSVQARLLIGADGKHSHVRASARIDVLESAYEQTAIVTTIAHVKPHYGLAQERFFPAGPFAVLPMQGNMSSLVWVEPQELAPVYLGLNDNVFLQEISKRVGGYLGDITLVGKRFSFPLSVMHASRYTDLRLALIGDAAHAIHPVAGQGVNLGWRDAAVLAEAIADAHRLGLDIGGASVLERYQRWRRFDNVAMMAMTDSLNRLFSNRSKLLHIARGSGFALVDKLPALKRFFMRNAMGMVGDLPKLMQAG